MNTMTKDRFQLEVYLQKAKKGDSEAQFALGHHYLEAKEYRNALQWFKKSAKQGHIPAMNAVAETYRAQHKYRRAEKWYKLSSNEGYADATYNLATLYLQSDSQQAGISLMQELVQDEYPPALIYYGDLLHKQGRLDEARAFYLKAGEAGASEAWSRLGDLEKEDGNPEQAQEYYKKGSTELPIPEPEQPAVELEKVKSAAAEGNVDAQYRLGIYYEEQEADLKQALYWYEQAAQQDHLGALFHLGNLYSEAGKGQVAAELYGIAAEQGHAPSQHRLGLMYEEENRIEEALHWYSLAAEQGDADSQNNLAYLLLQQGEREMAARWFLAAAEQGDAMAQYNYAILLQQDHRFEEALEMYRAAARQGLEASQQFLRKHGETW